MGFLTTRKIGAALALWCLVSAEPGRAENVNDAAIDAMYGLCFVNDFSADRLVLYSEGIGFPEVGDDMIGIMQFPAKMEMLRGWLALSPEPSSFKFLLFAARSADRSMELCSLYFPDVVAADFMIQFRAETGSDLIDEAVIPGMVRQTYTVPNAQLTAVTFDYFARPKSVGISIHVLHVLP